MDPVYKKGDNRAWANKNLIDTGWLKEHGEVGDGIFWIRIKLELKQKSAEQIGVKVESFGAFELYWDGTQMGRNGRVAAAHAKEIPGAATSYYSVPDSLTQLGTHVLAFRTSQAYSSEQRGIGISINSYASLLKTPLIITSFMNLMAGAFLIAAIYYLFLYINSKYRSYSVLVFAISCFLFFALLILEYIKFYIAIPYTRFYVRLEAIGWLTFAISMLVPLYFTIQFQFRWKKQIMPLLFITLMTIYIWNFGHYDLTAIYYSLTMWSFSLTIVFAAIYQKEKGGVVVFMGLLASALVYQYLEYDFSLFISFSLIVLCMLYLHTIRMKGLEEEHQSSLLLSSRLKLELIKKNIQPHFIKNTLTSLIDWVEESPKDGVAFIEALADEFDVMNEISEKTLIPIGQEIELCKKHLTVMQFRKEIAYQWEEEGIDEREWIPPALLHTLLENGITHSMALSNGRILFKLSFLRGEGYKEYIFETIGNNRLKTTERPGGNGFLYIRSRLTESYGEAWAFTSKPNSRGWLSSIKIYTK